MNAEAPPFGLSLRLPPTNLRAEQALLGALLANNRCFERVGEFLKAEHFADPIHSRIFAAIARRIEAGQLADVVTLKAEFEHLGMLDDVGGTAYLAQLLSAMVALNTAGEYGRAIHDTWIRRQLIELGETVVNDAYGVGADVSGQDQVEAAAGAFGRLSEGTIGLQQDLDAGEAVAAAIRAGKAAMLRGTGLAGLATGSRVLRWELVDVSVVAVPSDVGAGVTARSYRRSSPSAAERRAIVAQLAPGVPLSRAERLARVAELRPQRPTFDSTPAQFAADKPQPRCRRLQRGQQLAGHGNAIRKASEALGRTVGLQQARRQPSETGGVTGIASPWCL